MRTTARRVIIAFSLCLLLLPRASAAPGQTADGGRFGRAVRPGERFPATAVNPVYTVLPITVECWAKLDKPVADAVLVANEPRHSGSHWSIYAQAETGRLAAFATGHQPQAIVSDRRIADGTWHYLAMVLTETTCRLFVDGQKVAEQALKPQFAYPDRGPLTVGYVDGVDAVTAGLIDEVRVSRGARDIGKMPDAPFEADDATIGLWHFDEPPTAGEFADASRTRNAATLKRKADVFEPRTIVRTRWQDMDLSPFISATIGANGPGKGKNVAYKGIAVGLGNDKRAAVCFDTELLRVSAAWTGDFLTIHPEREGLAKHPDVAGDLHSGTAFRPGWAKPGSADFTDPRPQKVGPLPKEWARYKGLYVNDGHVIFAYTVGKRDVLEMPWFEMRDLEQPAGRQASADPKGVPTFVRTFEVGPGDEPMLLRVAERMPAENGQEPLGIELINAPAGAEIVSGGPFLGVKLPASAEASVFSLRVLRGAV